MSSSVHARWSMFRSKRSPRGVLHHVFCQGRAWRTPLIALLVATVSSSALIAAEPELVYTKKDSRRSSFEAAIAATNGVTMPSKWHLIGPFDNAQDQGLEIAYPPERKVDLSATYPGKEGETAAWTEVNFPDGKVHTLRKFKKSEQAVCYLYRAIESPKATRVRASIGFDDAMAVILNGQTVFVQRESDGAMADQAFVNLDLAAGRNELLLKVVNRKGNWAFYFQPTLSETQLALLERRLDADFPQFGEAAHYRISTLPLPENELIEVGGLAFRGDGKLYVATRRGDIWLVDHPLSEDPTQISMRRYATGLHEVLGLTVVGDNDLYLSQRPEITLVRDTDGDDVADDFSVVCDQFGISGDYHEFLYGPVRNRAGDWFLSLNLGFGGGDFSKVPYRGFVLRVDPVGNTIPFASGLRSPNGLVVSPDDRIYATDNQGEWVASCKLQEVREGDFCGHQSSLKWLPGQSESEIPPVVPPAIWFPFSVVRSASEPTWDTTGGRFGPFEGQCFVGELTNSLIMRVALEEVQGRMQGACFLFRKGFNSGVNRLCFAPDGSMIVGQTNRGWGSIGGKPHGLDRVVFTGSTPLEVHSMRVTPEGWDLVFTKPMTAASVNDRAKYSLESYTYHYWRTYGSPEIERRQHEITEARLSDDGRTVRLAVPERKTGRVYRLRLDTLQALDGTGLSHRDAWYTLNQLP